MRCLVRLVVLVRVLPPWTARSMRGREARTFSDRSSRTVTVRSRTAGFFLIALAVGAFAASGSFADDPPTPTAVEYKFRLDPGVSDAETRDRLWVLIGSDSAHVTQKKCRAIQFLDIQGDRVHELNFAIRHRAKLDGASCPASMPVAGKGQLTLKFRDADPARAAEQAQQEWAAGAGKFEEDVVISKGSDGQLSVERAYSVSADVDKAKAPQTVEALRESYPAVLPSLTDTSALAPGCRRVLEERWSLEPESPDLPEEIEIVIWHAVSEFGARVSKPVLAELSFKAPLDGKASQRRADELAARLVRTLGAAALAPGGSKTSAVSGCES